MAKKQTLKSLLGVSDERVQVSYDPSEITLTPTVQQTRGSATVVQATPKTNQALNFARALSQTPQVLGALSDIGEAQAVEDFSQITSDAEKDELLNQQKSMSRMLGYDKKFQEVLIKDYYVRNADSISNRFTALAADPSKYNTLEEFNAALDAEKETFIGELQEQFGNNPNRVVAINAIGNEVMTQVNSQTVETFLKNQREQTFGTMATHLETQVGSLPNEELLTQFVGELRSIEGIENAEVSAEFAIQTRAIGNRLMQQGRLEEARAFIEASLEFEFFKGAKISGQEQINLTSLLDQIETKQENEAEERSTEEYEQDVNYAAQQLTTAYGYASNRAYESLTSVEKQVVLSGLQAINPEFTQEDLDKAVQEAGSLHNALETITAKFSIGSDMVKNRMSDVFPMLRSGRQTQQTLTAPNIVRDKDKDGHVENFKKAKLTDPDLTADNYAKNNNIVNFPELETADTEHEQLAWFYNDPRYKEAKTQFRTAIAVLDEAKAGEGAKSSKDLINSYLDANFQEVMDDITTRVISGELTEESAWQELERYKKEAAERFVNTVHYEDGGTDEDLNINEMSRNVYDLSGFAPSDKTAIGKSKKDADKAWWKMGFFEYDATKLLGVDEYDSIGTLFGGKNINTENEIGGRTAQEVIDADRLTMLENIESEDADKSNQARNALKFSLGHYGVDIYEISDDPDKYNEVIDMLDKVQYDAFDVQLFSNSNDLTQFMRASAALFNKVSNNLSEELTDEEKTSLEQLNRLGIKSTNDLNALGRAQAVYGLQVIL
jgi:hypothetical protein